MSPEAQRIAIAKACGWIDLFITESESVGRRDWGQSPKWKPDFPEELRVLELPNYLHNLNAMHEAEKTLNTDELQRHYVDELFNMIGGKGALRFRGRWAMATATAAQKAEAFLKSLDLWKD